MSDSFDKKNWQIAGLMATIIIVISIPLSILVQRDIKVLSDETDSAQFVGRKVCLDCHKKEYDLWLGSDHDKAMDTANDSSVLGDFNDAVFTSRGISSKFYKKDEKYYVFTAGPEGKPGEFQITHTFGYTPLQQYLVPFPGGKYQCLPIAWDTENKKWYDMAGMVYSESDLRPDNWLYWTNQAQNWNGMCAECHSTNLKKNYDVDKGTFNTTWSEIDVSCEACHGPGSKHADWAKLPEMSRDNEGDLGLLIKNSEISPRQNIELCAPCHSRRGSIQEYDFEQPQILNNADPQLIVEPLYHIDGQIREEDYVYGSFLQSKMYLNDVQCNDCHDVHSGKRLFEGNKLCLQCHRENEYDTYDHHFHKFKGQEGTPLNLKRGRIIEVGEGALCEKCHMPAQYYMGIDFRPDHSLRVPRPDLTVKLNVPNACNSCHEDNTPQWAEEYMVKWYGEQKKEHYGEIFSAALKGNKKASQKLITMISDPLYSEIVRATAVYYLSNLNDPSSMESVKSALNDNEALVRLAAVRGFSSPNSDDFINSLAPMLNDPIKTVRINVSNHLNNIPNLDHSDKRLKELERVSKEYKKSILYMADFPSGRYNLGNFYFARKKHVKAKNNYIEAIKMDEKFIPAKMNLAMLYYSEGNLDEVEKIYLDIIQEEPELSETYYNLGLLYAEQKKFEKAAKYLELAAKKITENYRIYYNLGLIYQQLKQNKNAEESFLKALDKQSDDPGILHALADHYIKTGEPKKAKRFALELKENFPQNPIGRQLLDYIAKQK